MQWVGSAQAKILSPSHKCIMYAYTMSCRADKFGMIAYLEERRFAEGQ